MQTRKFPRGGVHLKHAAISPCNTRIISGVPPLTIRASKPCDLQEITIYGNTENGVGVGDKTANLLQIGGDSGIHMFGFSSDLIRTVSETRKLSNNYGTTISTTSPANSITVSQSSGVDAQSYTNGYFYIGLTGFTQWTTYTFSWDIEFSSASLTHPSSMVFYTQSANNGSNSQTGTIRNGKLVAKIAIRETDYPMIQLRCHGASFTLSNFMLVKGSYSSETMPAYEPYGYKLPISISEQSSSEAYSFDHYISAPLYTYADTASFIPQRNRFRSPTIAVNTSVPPSQLTVKYTS